MEKLVFLDYEFFSKKFYSTISADVEIFKDYIKHNDVVLVGYNVATDLYFLGLDAQTVKYIDVYEMFTKAVNARKYKATQTARTKKGHASLKLQHVCSWCGIELNNPHNPVADTLATYELYKFLIAQGVQPKLNTNANSSRVWC